MEVLRVLVQDQAAEFLHPELVARPNFGYVKRVEAELLGIGVFGLHHLEFGGPCDFLTALDGLVQVTLGVVGVLAAHLCRLLLSELLLAVVCDEVVLDIDKLSFRVHPLESVAAVAVVEAPSAGSAVIAKEHEASVVALRRAGEEIEDAIIVNEEVLGVSVLRTDDIRALNRVATEVDGLRRSAQVDAFEGR